MHDEKISHFLFLYSPFKWNIDILVALTLHLIYPACMGIPLCHWEDAWWSILLSYPIENGISRLCNLALIKMTGLLSKWLLGKWFPWQIIYLFLRKQSMLLVQKYVHGFVFPQKAPGAQATRRTGLSALNSTRGLPTVEHGIFLWTPDPALWTRGGEMQVIEMKWVHSKSVFLPLCPNTARKKEERYEGRATSQVAPRHDGIRMAARERLQRPWMWRQFRCRGSPL